MRTFILTVSALATTSSVLYLYFFHEKLSRKIHHSSRRGTLPSSVSRHMTSVPPEVFTSERYALYDAASTSAPRHQLPDVPAEELLTRLLRRNMSKFAHFPQAWLLKMVSSCEDRQSFGAQYIRSLDFQEGDLVCGMYRVARRTASKVEFEMKPTTGVMGARLVVRLEETGDDVVFHNETVMWKSAREKAPLPLERGLVMWVHETAAWWLLDSGVRFLMDSKGEI